MQGQTVSRCADAAPGIGAGGSAEYSAKRRPDETPLTLFDEKFSPEPLDS